MILPGDYICKEEEYIPHKYVYVDERGNIRSAVIGKVVFDTLNRRVLVKPLKDIKIPKTGDIVIGWITSMRDDVAFIKVVGYDFVKLFKHSFTAVLHISQATDSRGDNMYNYVRIGDVVKVKVLNDYLPLLVTIKEPKLGVMLAYCSRCGSALHYDGNKLICSVCGNTEQRKVSLDYILVRGKRSGS
jgi:exosome complex component CSL4